MAALAAMAMIAHTGGSQRRTATPRLDAELQRKVARVVADFHGDVGVYVYHVPSGRTAAIRADELFPTASLVKVPILIGLFDAVERGVIDWAQPLYYRDSLAYAGDDITERMRDSAKISLGKVAMLMATASDNTAALWIQGLVGGANVNAWLHAHGYDSTRINSRVAGREANRSAMGWGQTSPREMASLLLAIRRGEVVSRAVSEEMYRFLTRSYWNGEALSQLPPWVQAASKQGFVDRSRSEVVLVNAPSGDYVFAVITKNAADQRYGADNEGFRLIRALSALLWREFEPTRPYAPDSAARRYKPPAELP